MNNLRSGPLLLLPCHAAAPQIPITKGPSNQDKICDSKNRGRLFVVVVALTLTRIIKSVVTGQAPVTLKPRNTPGKTHTTQGGTSIYRS